MIEKAFFNRPTLKVAQDLLGKVIIRNNIKAMIVEVESYIGPIDKGCHAYNFNKTKRNKVMFERYGIAYIYLIYGMYNCLNFVTEEINMPCAILIRSVEILEGKDIASNNRYNLNYDQLSKKQIKNLSNGPGKLCIALNLTRKQNKLSLISKDLYIEDIGYTNFEIVKTKRVNIDYAKEAIDFPWRFYIKDHSCVSIK